MREAMHIETVDRLTLREQLRLLEIAHETRDAEVKAAALAMLKNYLFPIVAVGGDSMRESLRNMMERDDA